MATNRFSDDLDVEGTITAREGFIGLERTSLAQENFARFALPPQVWRVWDAFATLLPGTSAADDLGVYAGAFGTGVPYLATSDLKGLGSVTRYARTKVQLPYNYVAGQSVRLAVAAGMTTAVADTAATLDVEVWKDGGSLLVSGSELVAAAAQSINSATFATKNFEITATTLSPGDWLDVRLTVLVNDAATAAGTVIAALATIELHLDIKG